MRTQLAEFAAGEGLAGVALSDLRTCVSEAVTNAVVHAYRDGRVAGTVTVSVQRHRDDLLVTVHDDGMGFAPRPDSPGLGLGLPTIGRLCDSMSISGSAVGGTDVCMGFALT
jgi:serine/threonine-protein kinase RsbW/stage II sporulation protein AB (anti-sigma F factor)